MFDVYFVTTALNELHYVTLTPCCDLAVIVRSSNTFSLL